MKLSRLPLGLIISALSLVALAHGALADDAPAAAAAAATPPAPKLDSGDTAWMLTSTALVLMMTIPGLALFYGGMVRKMNVLSTIMQSFAITCVVTILWMVIGYSLAFTEGSSFVGGLSRVMFKGLDFKQISSLAPTIPESVYAMYQLTFAIITCALLTGSLADRMKFSALLVFTSAWLIVDYCPIAHWVWGGGFVGGSGWGVLDYAGGTVVHVNAGVAGLVGALYMGKRKGYGHESMAPHNLVLSVIGAALLWVGWFGFNAGSASGANANAGMAMLATQVATAAAALSWMFAEWLTKGKPSVLGIISGAVAGLVAITPASGFVQGGGALVIGLAAGIVCFIASTSVKNALGYDDSLDAFGVHGIGGALGAILTGVFAIAALSAQDGPPPVPGTSGLLEGNAAQVLIQLKGVLVTSAYTAVVSFVLFWLVDMIVGLRVDTETEREGLDLRLHGETVH